MTGEMSKKSVHGFDIVRDMCKFAPRLMSRAKHFSSFLRLHTRYQDEGWSGVV